MSLKKCFGYYLVKPLPCPCFFTHKADKILSVSDNGLSDKFPDLSKCFWKNSSEKDKITYAKYLGLNSNEFPAFCENVSDLFSSGRLTASVRFCSSADAVMLSRYIKNHRDYKLVGLFTDIENFSRFENEGYFSAVGAGDDNITGKLIGCDIIGCDYENDGHSFFDSYTINALNEVLEKKVDLQIDRNTGLIRNGYDEAKRFAAIIQGQGEPVIWTPFEIYEMDIPENQ